MAKKDVKNDEIMYFKMNSIMKKTTARFFAIDTPCILYLNVVILKDRHGEVFFEQTPALFFLEVVWTQELMRLKALYLSFHSNFWLS